MTTLSRFVPSTGARRALTLATYLAMGASSTSIARTQPSVGAGGQGAVPYPASVTPVMGPPGSHAFDSIAFNHVPQNLAAVGYHEQEHFLSGMANAYQYGDPTNPADDRVIPI